MLTAHVHLYPWLFVAACDIDREEFSSLDPKDVVRRHHVAHVLQRHSLQTLKRNKAHAIVSNINQLLEGMGHGFPLHTHACTLCNILAEKV